MITYIYMYVSIHPKLQKLKYYANEFNFSPQFTFKQATY